MAAPMSCASQSVFCCISESTFARRARAGQSFPSSLGPSRTRRGFFDFEVGGHDGAY